MPRTKPRSTKVYVSQRQAAEIIGVSQSRITQLAHEGKFSRNGRPGNHGIEMHDVRLYQRKRIEKMTGRRPMPFALSYNHQQLALEITAQEIAKNANISEKLAKKWVGSVLRITSFHGSSPVTIYAEVERVRAEKSLATWRQYYNKALHAKENESIGDYNIDADIRYAKEQIEWITTTIENLTVITSRAILENRTRITRELYENPPVSREEWRASHPRTLEDIPPEVNQAIIEEVEAELAEEEELAEIHARAQKIREDFEKELANRSELESFAFNYVAGQIRAKFERGDVSMNEEEMERKLIEIHEEKVQNPKYLEGHRPIFELTSLVLPLDK